MRRLVIHPDDTSTAFLSRVYENFDEVTLVRGDVSRSELEDLIGTHDQVTVMGHGTRDGLLSVGSFPDSPGYVIDDSFASLLAEKRSSVFIWCNAHEYVERHCLNGFYTGMFVSELGEAHLMGINGATQCEVDESNDLFANTVGASFTQGPRLMHAAARKRYGHLAKYNQIAEYNREKLYLSSNGQTK